MPSPLNALSLLRLLPVSASQGSGRGPMLSDQQVKKNMIAIVETHVTLGSRFDQLDELEIQTITKRTMEDVSALFEVCFGPPCLGCQRHCRCSQHPRSPVNCLLPGRKRFLVSCTTVRCLYSSTVVHMRAQSSSNSLCIGLLLMYRSMNRCTLNDVSIFQVGGPAERPLIVVALWQRGWVYSRPGESSCL